jgi:hypothetical protein
VRPNRQIPAELIADWTTKYVPAIQQAISQKPFATLQFLSVSHIPVGLNLSNAGDTIVSALWYNVFATNDTIATLDGNPYDNIGHIYKGSLNDVNLNASVARFAGDTSAQNHLANYETDGLLLNPLVTLHTTADPQVALWPELVYLTKVESRHSLPDLDQIPVLAFGHCNVTASNAESALTLLLLKTDM